MKRVLKYFVTKDEDGWAIRQILRERLEISRALLIKMKGLENGILKNGRNALVSEMVFTGDEIALIIGDGQENSQSIAPTEGRLDIVFEDLDVLVISKEANVAVHPSQGHYYDSLASHVMWHYKSKGENFVFRPVNRLDRGTSGLILIAKNAYAHERLAAQMKLGQLKKTYLAVAEGMVQPEKGRIDHPIGRKEGSVIARRVRPDGKRARTNYSVLCYKNGRTLVEIELETGRTHQIRVHFSYIGHPLVGDFLYGRQEESQRHALHSARLEFFQPVEKQLIRLECEMPQDMKQLLKEKD